MIHPLPSEAEPPSLLLCHGGARSWRPPAVPAALGRRPSSLYRPATRPPVERLSRQAVHALVRLDGRRTMVKLDSLEGGPGHAGAHDGPQPRNVTGSSLSIHGHRVR